MKRILFVVDPLETLKPSKDTSYFMMVGAGKLGHEVYCAEAGNFQILHDSVSCLVRQVQATDDLDAPFIMGELQTFICDHFDTVIVRTDPPFDRRYFYLTLILDRLPASVQVVNRPQALRDHNEKIAALNFPDLTPDTIITRSTNEIRAFSAKHRRITVKPVDGFGGRGIVFINYGDPDDAAIIEGVTQGGKHWVVAQEYLPAASDGDKRILLLDGDPLGAILRVHADGAELNNLDQGGEAVPSDLNARDTQICERVGPWLVENGVRFAGIDVIGDYLIEINVTSPTGLREMAGFTKRNLDVEVMRAIS